MRRVVLVSADLAWAGTLAAAWAKAGDTVNLVLLDDAVSAGRAGHASNGVLSRLLDDGVHVAAHDGALQRRGISATRLASGVKTVDLDEVADLLADGADRVVWS